MQLPIIFHFYIEYKIVVFTKIWASPYCRLCQERKSPIVGLNKWSTRVRENDDACWGRCTWTATAPGEGYSWAAAAPRAGPGLSLPQVRVMAWLPPPQVKAGPGPELPLPKVRAILGPPPPLAVPRLPPPNVRAVLWLLLPQIRAILGLPLPQAVPRLPYVRAVPGHCYCLYMGQYCLIWELCSRFDRKRKASW